MVEKIVAKAVQTLGGDGAGSGGVIKRDRWLREAEGCEEGGGVDTAKSIVKHAIGLGVEDEDRLRTWRGDAEAALERGKVEVARAIYLHMLGAFKTKKRRVINVRGAKSEVTMLLHEQLFFVSNIAPSQLVASPSLFIASLLFAEYCGVTRDSMSAQRTISAPFLTPTSLPRHSLWLKAVELEKKFGDKASLEERLKGGVESCPRSERLWLMYAKEKWLGGDVQGGERGRSEATKCY